MSITLREICTMCGYCIFCHFEKLVDSTYGWTEFIISNDCVYEEQISRFYERQGGIGVIG
jgi:lantibiotic modifying enzyme